MWDVPASFSEALDWFRSRLPLTKSEWDRIDQETRKQAYTVAGVAQLRIVSDTHAAVTRGIEAGDSLETIKATIAPALTEAWQGSVANPPARLETIVRTNTQTAYSAGRERLASHPTVRRQRPYARYDAITDTRTTDQCSRLHGTVKRQDDPWWATHTPPLHFGCRSGKVTLTAEQAEAEGITEDAPDVDAAEGFGSVPEVGEWEPNPDGVPPELWDIFQSK